MNQQDFHILLDKYLDGTATEEEQQLLFRWYNTLQEGEPWNEEALGSRDEVEERLFHRIQGALAKGKEAPVVPLYRRTFFRVAAAAALLFVLAGAAWQFFGKPAVSRGTASRMDKKVPLPGREKARLVLHNGKTILLDTAADGLLADVEGVLVRKEGGRILYEVAAAPVARSGQKLHRISTGKGGQYEVVLPDGSAVWLNTASSLQFPVHFAPGERRVDVTGEVYFEVAKNKALPFRVGATGAAGNRSEIEVLGTHFNINAYADESVLRTTLLEGSVKVSSGKATPKVLVPGQQARVTGIRNGTQMLSVHRAEREEVMAWKNNLFDFHTADIQTIMRQIARWYDVDVVYEGRIPQKSFSGKISRNTSLSNVLRIMEQSNMHFRMQGRTVIVTP